MTDQTEPQHPEVAALQRRVAELEHLLEICTHEVQQLRVQEKRSGQSHEAEQQRIEQALEHSFALLQATLNSTSDGLVVVAQDGSIVHYNHTFQALWNLPDGWETVSTPSEHFALLIDQVKDRDRFLKGVIEEQYDHQDTERHDILELTNGRVIERYSTPYRFGDAIAGRVWSIRDVTERERDKTELQRSRGRLKAIFDNAAVAIGLLDATGRPVQVNERWAEMLGYALDEITHIPYTDTVHPDERAACIERLYALASGERDDYRLERRFVRKDGSMFWGDFSVRTIRSDSGELESLIGIITDTTERKIAEESLQEVNEQLIDWIQELEQRNRDVTLLNKMGEFLQSCLTVNDVYGVVEQFGAKMFLRHTGALHILTPNPSETQLEAVSHWGTLPTTDMVFAPDDCWSLRRSQAYIVEDAQTGLLCPHIHTSESFTTICIPLIAQNETLGLLHLRAGHRLTRQARDRLVQLATTVAERVALALANLHLRERLRHQSIHDALTGLFNRRYLQDVLKHTLLQAEQNHTTVGLMMLDIDHFKRFNDVYGHDAGDTLLRSLGAFLQTHIRDDDIACRYGGEEFTILFPQASLENTHKRAEELREGVKHLDVQHNGQTLGVITISAGVACFPQHGSTAEEVLRVADNALLQAKARGRDQVVVPGSSDTG